MWGVGTDLPFEISRAKRRTVDAYRLFGGEQQTEDVDKKEVTPLTNHVQNRHKSSPERPFHQTAFQECGTDGWRRAIGQRIARTGFSRSHVSRRSEKSMMPSARFVFLHKKESESTIGKGFFLIYRGVRFLFFIS